GHYINAAVAKLQAIPLTDQQVKLMAIGDKAFPLIEDLLKGALHLTNRGTDNDARTALSADVIRRGQVVGMGMGFQYIIQRQRLLPDPGENGVNKSRTGTSGFLIKVQYRVDNGRTGSTFIDQQMGKGESIFVEKCLDADHCGISWLAGHY